MTAQPTPRQQARAQTMRRILEIARSQLETQGAAALSLREVARELGMVSSAVYRYVASRDELLTLLLVDAFEDLAGAVEAALDTSGQPVRADSDDGADGADGASEALLVLAQAMRSWAVAHRAQWTLLYGTPVAEYHAPAEVTTHPGTRVVGRTLAIIASARVPQPDATQPDESQPDAPQPDTSQSGSPAAAPVSAELARLLDEASAELGIPAATTAQQVAATTFFSGVVGAINAELFTHWGPQFDAHGAELFTAQMRLLAQAAVA